jgi:hypothetical protein
MIELNQVNNAKVGIPPAFRERCAVRITDAKVAPNSKGKPMITINQELVGYYDNNNNLHSELVRGETTYKLAGLSIKPSYFTLTKEAAGFYADFYQRMTGEALTAIDETNPAGLEELKAGPVMQAIVQGTMQVFRKQLTDEQKEELKAQGKPQVGEPITDDEGKPIETAQLEVKMWLKPHEGELPSDVAGE